MPRYRVLRQRIVVEEAEVQAPTRTAAMVFSEAEHGHAGSSDGTATLRTDWRETENRLFVLTTAEVK